MCMEDADPGPCRGYFQRWAFNPRKLMCVPFAYGGCRGNRNNFLTADECGNTCGVVRRQCFIESYARYGRWRCVIHILVSRCGLLSPARPLTRP